MYEIPIKLINNKVNNTTKDIPNNISNFKGKNKYFVPSGVEWFNSVYLYNTNNIKSIPVLDKISSKFIKMYFNMYNVNLEKKVGLRKLTKRKRWLSDRKSVV